MMGREQHFLCGQLASKRSVSGRARAGLHSLVLIIDLDAKMNERDVQVRRDVRRTPCPFRRSGLKLVVDMQCANVGAELIADVRQCDEQYCGIETAAVCDGKTTHARRHESAQNLVQVLWGEGSHISARRSS